MKKIKKITALLLAALLVLSLAACGEVQEDVFTVSVALPEEIATLDPAMVTNDAERMVVNHLFENLMKLTNDGQGRGKVVGGMASGYECVNNLDGTQTYTFTLRAGIMWADGKPVTADDFVFAWRRLADPATESPNAALLKMVAGYAEARKKGDMEKLQVTAVDEKTLEVVLSAPCLYFAEVICTHAATMPVRQDMVQAEDWAANPATLVANGPYRNVQSWDENGLTLTSDETYYEYRRLGPDALCFTGGEADFRLTYEPVDQEEALWTMAPVAQTGTLVINQMSTLSEELRQALSLTIDRVAISAILGSNYTAAEGLIPYGVRNTQGEEFRLAAGALIDNDPEQYEARCEAARTLLQGQELPETGNVLLLYVSDPATDQVAQTLRAAWQEQLGLSVELHAVQREEMDKALADGEFTVALAMLTCQINDASDMLRDWVGAAAENYAHIDNSAYDLLMRISDASTSVVARDAYLGDAERMLLESGYVVPICHVTGSWLLSDELTGVFSDGFGCYYFTGVMERAK